MLGYSTTLLPGMTLLPFQDVQPTVQPTLQQIEQAMDITPEPVGKMLNCKVSAAVRLQAAARGLLARRQLQEMRQKMQEAVLAAVRLQAAARGILARRQAREMRGLQLVPVPRAPLLRHQAALRHMEGPDLVRCVMEIGRAIATSGDELGIYSADVWGRGCVATHRRTLIGAAVLRHRPPRGRLRWPQVRLHQPPPVQCQGYNPAFVEGRTLSLQAAGWGPPLFKAAVEIKSLRRALWSNN
jgi:hypothetical protein